MWTAENLLRGVSREEVAARLHAEGIRRSDVEQLLATLERSPVFEAARPLAVDARRLAMLTRLLKRLERASTDATTIPRRGVPAATEFQDLFVAANRPVILTDLVPRWPAFGRWTPATLSQRFGAVEVSVTMDRENDPDYDMKSEAHTRKMLLRDFVTLIESSTGDTNDFYMVANNRVLERTALKALLDEVDMPSDLLDPSRVLGASALWLGPAGTVTPLHHDTSNILFCQVHGRKRYRLVSPHEMALLDGARAMYAGRDPERDNLGGILVKDVVLEPGEALFIPVGWWHHVRALDASISLAFNNFRTENNFDWYRPSDVR